MHFSLVKMNPEAARPSHGFDDVMLPLFYSLQRLGYKAEILFNRTNPASRNIIFGSCIAPRSIGRELPKNSIIFNLEQLGTGSKWSNPHYLAHLRDFTVWDYSVRNIEYLADHGIAAERAPLGYVPEMTRLPKSAPPDDIDLLFYGLVTERRDPMLRRLAAGGIRLLVSQEAFGDLRDKLLWRARLLLNLHNYLPARLEVVRLGYVWANKKPVLSERRADTEIPDYLAEACVFAEYENILQTAARLLAAPAALRRQGEAGFRAFASRPMTDGLEKIIGRRALAAGSPSAIIPHGPAGPNGRPEWLIRG